MGATNPALRWAKGVQAYRLGSVSKPGAGGNRARANDARVNLAGIRTFLEFVYRAVTDVAAAR